MILKLDREALGNKGMASIPLFLYNRVVKKSKMDTRKTSLGGILEDKH